MKRRLCFREDASERAHKKLKAEGVRTPLEHIGFWDGNRGGLGFVSHHVHHVALQCMREDVKLLRYGRVVIVEIPKHRLEKVQTVNEERCAADKLMPNVVGTNIRYVCLTNTHFIMAMKSAKDRKLYLYNSEQNGRIMLHDHDGNEEAALILKSGPMCAIYESSLYDDIEAMKGLACDAILNEIDNTSEDEMSAFRRAHEAQRRLALRLLNNPHNTGSAHWCNIACQTVLAALQPSVSGQFSIDQWRDIISLQLAMGPCVAELFQACKFQACGHRVRVQPADFGLIAKLGPRAQWPMAALMLAHFQRTFDKHHYAYLAQYPEQSGFCQEVFAKKLCRTTMEMFFQEQTFLISLHDFIAQLMATYDKKEEPDNAVMLSDLIEVRGRMIFLCGSLMLKVCRAHMRTVASAEASEGWLDVDIVPELCEGWMGYIEDDFRSSLLRKKLYTNDTLPAALYPIHPPVAPASTEST